VSRRKSQKDRFSSGQPKARRRSVVATTWWACICSTHHLNTRRQLSLDIRFASQHQFSSPWMSFMKLGLWSQLLAALRANIREAGEATTNVDSSLFWSIRSLIQYPNHIEAQSDRGSVMALESQCRGLKTYRYGCLVHSTYDSVQQSSSFHKNLDGDH
jgi:hypothetical protein